MAAPRAAPSGAPVPEAAAAPAQPAWPATIAVVGAGRAGGALAIALTSAGRSVVAVASRDAGHAAVLAAGVGARAAPTALAAISAADLTLFTVPDAAIAGVAASVAESGPDLRGRAVVHCSASLGIGALAALRPTGASVGCLHPFQALAGAESAPLLRGALMAIEADPALEAPLRRLAEDLGGQPIELRPGTRALYHAAAVLAGNAPLALLSAASELLVAAGLEQPAAEEALIGLMEGALANARRVGPRAALTGPVARGDTATVAAHLEALHERPDTAALYRALTQAILLLAGEEGREEISDMLNGHREGGAGLRAERRLCADGSSNAAAPGSPADPDPWGGDQRAPSASQGARTPVPERSASPDPPSAAEASAQPASGPQRSTTPASPLTTEDPTCQ
jgi:predicted short-subunit dehydrogenase-like oxidoreductase (DUF2520 family)